MSKQQNTTVILSATEIKNAVVDCVYSCVTTNALRVNNAPCALGSLVAEVTLAGLVKEGVSAVGCVARDLLPGAVLALDAVAPQMAAFHSGFATLDPGHLGDLGQSTGLGSCSTAHPGGHSAVSGGDRSWFSRSDGKERKDNIVMQMLGKKVDKGQVYF